MGLFNLLASGRRGGREVYVVNERPRIRLLRCTAVAAGITGFQYLITLWLPGSLLGLLALAVPAFLAAKSVTSPKVTGTPVAGVYVDGGRR